MIMPPPAPPDRTLASALPLRCRRRPADGVLDVDALGDGDVAEAAADVGEEALAQVDDLVVAVAGEVEGVAPAGVPDREDDRLVLRGDHEPGAVGV
jgi:hypothetical protein